jgi:prevent-host-death family protein
MCYSCWVPDINWRSNDEGAEVSVRDLRNHTSEVLRRVEAGEPVTVTVDRRPVARLVPLSRRRDSIPTTELFARLAEIGGGADPGLRNELRAILTETTDDVGVG